jgi:Tol biopolymer transport system component
MLLEGSVNWNTTSVSWLNENEFGVVPLDRYAMITISQQAAEGGPSHFLYQSTFAHQCQDLYCLPGGDSWVDADLTIDQLDWSPRGARVVLEGRERLGQSIGPVKVFMMPPDGSSRRDFGRGLMPSFSRNGAQIVYVTSSKEAIRLINAETGAGGEAVIDLDGIEHPRMSPGDSLIAFSAHYGNFGRRIAVADARHPEYFPDVVSDPDDDNNRSRDGVNDNLPTWSPGSRYVAYVATITRDGSFRDTIFLTEHAAEPEEIYVLHQFDPGQRVRSLRWHPGGTMMLMVIEGNVHVLVVPERFRDLTP